jgi:hypothetical protein
MWSDKNGKISTPSGFPAGPALTCQHRRNRKPMKRDTLGNTRFVGIFNNRRVPSDAIDDFIDEENSEDGLKA